MITGIGRGRTTASVQFGELLFVPKYISEQVTALGKPITDVADRVEVRPQLEIVDFIPVDGR
jgi:hypothetical protein